MSQNKIKFLLAISVFIAYVSIVLFIKLAFSYNETEQNCDLELLALLVSILTFSMVTNNLSNQITY